MSVPKQIITTKLFKKKTKLWVTIWVLFGRDKTRAQDVDTLLVAKPFIFKDNTPNVAGKSETTMFWLKCSLGLIINSTLFDSQESHSLDDKLREQIIRSFCL